MAELVFKTDEDGVPEIRENSQELGGRCAEEEIDLKFLVGDVGMDGVFCGIAGEWLGSRLLYSWICSEGIPLCSEVLQP